MASELELKLAACPDKLNQIKELDFPGISSQSPWQTKNLINVYFDNSNYKLRELGVGVRIRSFDEQRIQCVKSLGKTVGGLHQRNEDEIELESEKLNIEAIAEPYLQILVEEAIDEGGELQGVFETNFERSSCELTFSDSTRIELALDLGTIVCGDQQLPICEVELELVEGSPDYIFAIGRYLIKELNLTLSNASKARRGYSLIRDFNPRQKVMQVTELSQGVEAEKAFEQICLSSLNHWQYYELFLDRDRAHGAILEMYRALMSLQHIYLVFGGLIPRNATKDLRRSWDWLGEAMRPIVDAAKHKRYLVRYLKLKADWDLVESQQQKIQQASNHMIEEFKKLLNTERYNLMMLNMSQWLYSKEWRDHIPEDERENLSTPIIEFARKQLEHMLKELKRDLGPKLEMQPENYFKQVSHLRRALDTGLFFGSLFDTQKRLSYRQPWVDVIDGIRELQMNQYIAKLQLENHNQDETDEWLEKRNTPILDALLETRRSAFKSNPYWA
jgi:triphosphatase